MISCVALQQRPQRLAVLVFECPGLAVVHERGGHVYEARHCLALNPLADARPGNGLWHARGGLVRKALAPQAVVAEHFSVVA